jgi:hypothetical protein
MYGRNALKGWDPSQEIPFPAALPGPIGQEKLKRSGILLARPLKEQARGRLQPIFSGMGGQRAPLAF